MAKIEPLAQFILSFDGKSADTTKDGGDITNKGVTAENLRRLYWNHWRADGIKDQSVANILVDWVYTSGMPGIAVVQAIVGVKANGIADRQTIAAINRQKPAALFDRIKACRRQYIDSIVRSNPSQKMFYEGWLKRLNAIEYGSLIDKEGNKIIW